MAEWPQTLIIPAIQTILIGLLTADRWVHRVTGPAPLESRVQRLEQRLDDGHTQSSKRTNELTIYLETQRNKFDDLSLKVSALEAELRVIRENDRRRPR